MNNILHIILLWLLMLGALILIMSILIDIVSLYLNLKRAKRGYGPSGIPGLSFLVYLSLLFPASSNIIANRHMRESMRILLIVIFLSVFHIFCHFVIPALYVKYLKRMK